jgi:hypothetical protein
VFLGRYEHNLHIKSKSIPVTGCGGPYVFLGRYERHLHIKVKQSRNRPWRPIFVSCEVLMSSAYKK